MTEKNIPKKFLTPEETVDQNLSTILDELKNSKTEWTVVDEHIKSAFKLTSKVRNLLNQPFDEPANIYVFVNSLLIAKLGSEIDRLHTKLDLLTSKVEGLQNPK